MPVQKDSAMPSQAVSESEMRADAALHEPGDSARSGRFACFADSVQAAERLLCGNGVREDLPLP